jgi:K+-sensing histidine kinase KdpD
MGTVVQDLLANHQIMDSATFIEHLSMLNATIVSLQRYCININDWEKQKRKIEIQNNLQHINEILIDVKKMYAPLMAFKKLTFDVAETNIVFKVDKDILSIVLLNLIDNAYKNTVSGFIAIKAKFEENTLQINISDTGKGMDKKEVDNIFNNKIQLSQSSLGYLIITDLLKKINGKINIDSKSGTGTTVIISLPNL